MFTPRRRRSTAARRVALGLIVVGTLAGAATAHAATHTYTNHTPLSGSATLAADSSPIGAAQQYPNLRYPNHKPVRGNYPGSYTSGRSTPAQRSSSGFDWLAAGAGAAAMLGLILLAAAAKAATRIARSRSQDLLLVLESRDDTRGIG